MNPDTNFGGLKAKKKDHYAHVKSGMSDFVKPFIYLNFLLFIENL